MGRFAERHQCVCLSDTSCSPSQAKNNIFLMFPLWNNRQIGSCCSKLQSSSLVNGTAHWSQLHLSLKHHMLVIVQVTRWSPATLMWSVNDPVTLCQQLYIWLNICCPVSMETWKNSLCPTFSFPPCLAATISHMHLAIWWIMNSPYSMLILFLKINSSKSLELRAKKFMQSLNWAGL